MDVVFFRPHSLCIPQGWWGGRGPEDFGGFLKFLEGKRGDGKISEGRKGRMPIFLDVIER